jgi:hypothetical protein
MSVGRLAIHDDRLLALKDGRPTRAGRPNGGGSSRRRRRGGLAAVAWAVLFVAASTAHAQGLRGFVQALGARRGLPAWVHRVVGRGAAWRADHMARGGAVVGPVVGWRRAAEENFNAAGARYRSRGRPERAAQSFRDARVQSEHLEAARGDPDALSPRQVLQREFPSDQLPSYSVLSTTHDATQGYRRTTTLERVEGSEALGKTDLDTAYEYLKHTHQVLETVDRQTAKEMTLIAEVFFSNSMQPNIAWDREKKSVGINPFHGYQSTLNDVAHEVGHGIVDHLVEMNYGKGLALSPGAMGQRSAVYESIADFWGALVDQYHARQPSRESEWPSALGPYSWSRDPTGLATRITPAGAVDHYQKMTRREKNHGESHALSALPTRALVEISDALGGSSWETTAPMIFKALHDGRITPETNFYQLAQAMRWAAGALHGRGSREQRVVEKAWEDRGIYLKFSSKVKHPIATLAEALRRDGRTHPVYR